MKAIQITVDDALLARLDADEEVRRRGRSAVFREAVEAHLRQRQKRATRDAYRKAYGGGREIGELADWADEGAWPEP